MGIASPPAAARNDKVWMVGGQLVGNYFNPLNSPHLERLRLKDVLENAVRTMYIELHRPLLTPSYLR